VEVPPGLISRVTGAVELKLSGTAASVPPLGKRMGKRMGKRTGKRTEKKTEKKMGKKDGEKIWGKKGIPLFTII